MTEWVVNDGEPDTEPRKHKLGCDEYHQHHAPECCETSCWCFGVKLEVYDQDAGTTPYKSRGSFSISLDTGTQIYSISVLRTGELSVGVAEGAIALVPQGGRRVDIVGTDHRVKKLLRRRP